MKYDWQYGERFFYVLCVCGLAILLFGCASAPPPPDDRYLSKEEGTALREKCEPRGGCVVIPVPVFQQLMNLLRQKTA